MYLNYYKEILGYDNIPDFLNKYLESPSLIRLKNIGYFCGMDYASSDIYQFREYISRYDHSLTVALLIYKLTRNKLYTVAGLLHDIATPCFSHVIDYMNKDYERQESTEEYTEQMIKNDAYLNKCLEEDNISVYDVANFKKYSIVDINRPYLCADRLDGIILTGIAWTKNITKRDIFNIVNNLSLFQNENNELEIGFISKNIALKVVCINDTIDKYCHANEDNYMMMLLASITKYAIDNNYIIYNDLYKYGENEILELFEKIKDKKFQDLLKKFKYIKKEDIKIIEMPKIKERIVKPLINGIRM